jgi:hypothetical protein
MILYFEISLLIFHRTIQKCLSVCHSRRNARQSTVCHGGLDYSGLAAFRFHVVIIENEFHNAHDHLLATLQSWIASSVLGCTNGDEYTDGALTSVRAWRTTRVTLIQSGKLDWSCGIIETYMHARCSAQIREDITLSSSYFDYLNLRAGGSQREWHE